MEFLRTFWRTFTAYLRGSRGNGPYPLTRFVYSRRHITAVRVKPQAFLPRNGETSVFQTRGLSRDSVWDLRHAARQDKDPKGRADFSEASLGGSAGLRFVLDDKPPRHGNILGWPVEKEAQIEIALELAAKATPLLFSVR